MVCPMCRRLLVKRYRVCSRLSWSQPPTYPKRRRVIKVYIPIWVCVAHKISVEINQLSAHIVSTKPRKTKPRHHIGSAAE